MPLKRKTLIALGYEERNGCIFDPDDSKQVDCEGNKQGHPEYNPFADFAEDAEETAAHRAKVSKQNAAKEEAAAKRGIRKGGPPIKAPVDVRHGVVAKEVNVPESVWGHMPEEKKGKSDHNQRAKKFMEDNGFCYYRVEHYDARTGRHKDLFGVFDAVAFAPESGTIGVQVTDSHNAPARVKKIKAWPDFEKWIEAGNRAMVLAFRPDGNRYRAEMTEVLP